MKYWTYYVPLCILAGYAGLSLFGPIGFWVVYAPLCWISYGICFEDKH